MGGRLNAYERVRLPHLKGAGAGRELKLSSSECINLPAVLQYTATIIGYLTDNPFGVDWLTHMTVVELVQQCMIIAETLEQIPDGGA